jgi:hypothetical protein
MSSVPLPLESPWRSGLRSARANLAPGFVLQLGALALVGAYYTQPGMRDALARVSALRADWGVAFSMLTTGVCGGVLPFLYLRSRAATRRRYTWAQGAAITAFWTYKGLEVDLWYRLLARVFGEGHGFGTIALKTFSDQFVYCPLFAVPVSAVIYEWTESHFRSAELRADLAAGRWYRRKVLPLLLSNLGVWLPAVCIIYALPTPLQLPLQNLVLCFFTLVVAHQVRRATPDTAINASSGSRAA